MYVIALLGRLNDEDNIMKESNEEFLVRKQEEFETLQNLIQVTLKASIIYNRTMKGRVGEIKSQTLLSLVKNINQMSYRQFI